MNGGTLYTIGELARRTGLAVRTIRFYSDAGVVPPAGRTEAGYRLYDLNAVARLDLVRTLRELGVDLVTVQRVLDREVSVPEVAAAHAEALDVQIRTLRHRRSVLRAVARRGSSPEEMELMHRLAQLSDTERKQIINDFIDEVFAGAEEAPFAAMMRGAMPELPDDPAPEQVEAWVELAELVQDPDFRARIRGMVQDGANRPRGGREPGAERFEEARQRIQTALDAGTAPESAAAAPVVDDVAALFADAYGETDGPAFRRTLLERIESGTDARAERYWRLLATINGNPPASPPQVPAFEWLIAALRTH